MRFSFILFVMLLFAAPAHAFTSEWVNQPHIKGRVVQEEGKLGVELEMEHGWYTYYKVPGEAGIPTTFDWTGSRDINVKKVTYPHYVVHDEGGLNVNAYEDNVVFPVDAEFGKKPYVKLTVNGAVCSDICIPYEIKIEADLPPVKATNSVNFSYFVIIGTALLAGLILNIMPCVLPVLSLKVLSVVKQSGAERKQARINFLATSTGIIFSFWLLAILTIVLKNAGMAVGWGIHFQSPIFVGVLLAITLLFAFSLFGFFHLRPPSWLAGSGVHNTLLGNFFSGMLATVLGTSCTAPILTTAVGFALSRGDLDIFIIFTLMGIGMATPFLLFALIPWLAQHLPKPGAWMNKVKMVMGVFLLATSLWLGYVLYSQLVDQKPMPVIAENGQWQVFTEEKIQRYVDDGKTVFVDITAEWCVNCKTNKVTVLDTGEITQLFSRGDIILLRGDMTKPNKELLSYIKKYDRYGIPFNIVYGPKAPEGVLLPPLLTKERVKESVKQASGK